MSSPAYGGSFIANITVQHQVWSQGPPNAHGVGVDQWAAPVTRAVNAIHPLHRMPHHDIADSEYVGRVMVDWIMVVPDPTVYSKNDRVVYNGATYRVQNTPINWGATNPFGFDNTFFGGEVHIQRVT